MDERCATLLFRARISGLDVELDEGRLKVTPRAGEAPATLMEAIRAKSGAIRAFLARQTQPPADVVTMFEAAVKRWPDRTALVDSTETMSYAELDREVNRLANQLIAHGVGTETRVGVTSPRNLQWAIAILAILKAGGAYLALGTRFPEETIATLCARRRVELVLCATGASGALERAGIRVLRLDDPATASDYSHPPARAIHPAQLAAVIPTSGSTGQPKLAALEHRALANFVHWCIGEYDLEAASVRGTALVLETFDAHLMELIPFFCAGATVFIVSDALRLDSHGLAQFMIASRITHSFLPTPLAEAFIAATQSISLPDLRVLITGGDVLRRTPTTARNYDLVNIYGPTEATVMVTHSYVAASGDTSLPPIGVPVAGMSAPPLDEALRPVAAGSPGELHLSGPNLGRGYLDDPRETALRFIPDPLAKRHGERQYRTGDLAYQRPDGQLQFIARKDRQLKVRGIRVEPGAVEAELLNCTPVRQAAVIVHPELPDSLVAFCTLKAPEESLIEADISDWRALYDEVYKGSDSAPESEYAGWNSSANDAPFPKTEMDEWAAATVKRVLARNPRSVLEIGAGTGIILTRIVQAIDRYDGIDISAQSLRFLRERLGRIPAAEHIPIQLRHLAGHELSQLPPASYDTVVMNSVTQYLTGEKYLTTVLDTAWERLNADGTLFIGDVRDLRLLEAFATYVQLQRNGTRLPADEIARRVRTDVQQEQELLLHPEYFVRWARRHSHTCEVLIAPKESAFENEMARFRYDVSIRMRSADEPAPVAPEHDIRWTAESLQLNTLEQYLRASEKRSVQIRGIPNMLCCDELSMPAAVRALDVIDACNRAGFRARALLNGELPGYFAVQAVLGDTAWPALPDSCDETAIIANEPARRRYERRQLASLREHLGRVLPDYLVPARLVALDEMPVTPNAKIDRRALANYALPDARREGIEPPTTATEKLVARWLTSTLGVNGVSRTDSLFDLGGHSLLAMRMAAYISEMTGLEFPVHRILRKPIVCDIAAELEERLGGAATAAKICEILEVTQ